MLRIAKHEPPAALADDELLRDITVGEGHRLGKPDAIPVREFARAVRKVRPATCAPIERIFMLGRAQQIEDRRGARSEEHTSELQSLMRISYAVFCLKKKKHKIITYN